MAHRSPVPPSGPSCLALCWRLGSNEGSAIVTVSGHFTLRSTSLIEDERCVVVSRETHLHVLKTSDSSCFSIFDPTVQPQNAPMSIAA